MSSDDDEDLKKAIALSLAATGSTNEESVKEETKSTTRGLLGLDRKAMEQERLARAASRKRDRSISPPPLRDSRKAPKLEETTTTLSSGALLRTFTTTVNQDQHSRKSPIANAANSAMKADTSNAQVKNEPTTTMAPGSVIYPNGVVKKTWAFGHERNGLDIKIEEVLEPSTLRIAVLSAFQWDMEWVFSKLKVPPNGGTTKCVFVMQAKEEELRKQMLEETKEMPFLRLCFPPMFGQTNCMHSKLMLLFHPDKLRVAIPTANLLNFDWGETGRMENSVFMIDLPRNSIGEQNEELTLFGQELLYFMDKQGFDQDVKDGILKFDFSATKDMAFVHTIGGVSYRNHAERTGLPGLASAVRHLGLASNNIEIDFAASSIGSLNDEFLGHVQAAARGENMIERAANGVSSAKSAFFNLAAQKEKGKSDKKSVRDHIRIFFPTKDTVRASTAGTCGTICLSRKWYENMPFPRSCFRDYRSVRKGLLSHNKILYTRGKQQTPEEKAKDIAWVYVGSSNMSESAWGKLSFDKKDKAWKTICRNWECGVLLPVPSSRLSGGLKKEEKEEKIAVKKETIEGEDSETESEPETESEDEGGGDTTNSEKLVGMDVFNGLVDPPFELPGQEFGDREPWYFQE